MPAIGQPVNARSVRTRAGLLGAARVILEDGGGEALTMAAVAERAGVTRRAVYLHFGSRSDLLCALFDHVAEEEALAASVAPIWDAPDAAAALDAWASHLAEYHPKVMAVDRAVQLVEHVDADAARHRRRVSAEQEAICRRLASRVADEGLLAPGWTVDTATDLLFGLIATEMVERLLVVRGWSPLQLATHLSLLLRSTLVAAARP